MKPLLISGTARSPRRPGAAEFAEAAQPQPAAGAYRALVLADDAGPHSLIRREGPVPRRLHRKQAAVYVGMSLSWLDKSRLRGDGPTYLEIGGRVVYDTRDLDDFLTRCRKPRAQEV